MKSFEFFGVREINQCALALDLHTVCDGLCNPSGVGGGGKGVIMVKSHINILQQYHNGNLALC